MAVKIDNSKILTDELQKLRDRIAQNIVAANANASGKTIRSLEVEVGMDGTDLKGTLWGRPYFGALETGSKYWKSRDAYKSHAPKWFADIMQEWIEAKGLDLNAYAVAYNIIQKGTLLYRQGGRDTIYSQEIPKTLDSVNKRIADAFLVVYTEHITLNTK